MRKALAAVATASLFVAGLTAPAQATPQAVAAAPTPNTNPSIAETCGLDATLILDASGSIQSAGAVNTVRNAGRDLMLALKDTNSTLRITQFATFSGQLSARVPVNSTTTGTGGSLASGLANYYTPPPPRPSGVTIYNGGSVENNALTWTNWEDGIKGIDRPELAIFMTDGDPTAYNVSASRTNVNTSSTGTALDNAITQANILKAAGTRVLVVGVGTGLTSTASQDRLKKISGPQLEKSAAALAGKTINQVDAVAFSDFAALGAFMRSVVTSLCGNSVTVQKLAQSAADADYVPTTGWDITVQPTVTGGFTWVDPLGPDNSAQTRATSGAQGTSTFQWKPKVPDQRATVRVSEAVKNDFTADRWTCDIKTADGATTTVSGSITNQSPAFQFEMSPSDVAACKIYNDFNYKSAISITKEAKDDPVRGNADGWNEVYTFKVTNTGNAPLTVVKPVDPKCSSISAPSGTGTATGLLQPGITWTYTCQAKIGPVATVTTALNQVNTVSVVGIGPDGATVSAQATETVAVKTPRIQIDKTAKETVSGDPIADGGSVPAGTQVTYMYAVTNTGNDILSLVRATAVTDDKCSPVGYVSGDAGDDQLLGLGEVWQYTCTKVLDPPSSVSSVTNLAEVTSKWSNPQDQQQNNGPVKDSDRMTIDIDRAANLRIVKVTNPGDVDQDFGFQVTGQGVSPDDAAFDLNTSTAPTTPPASRDLLLDGPAGSGSDYTITESATDGWDLTDISCSKDPTSQTETAVTLTILPTEDVTCAFTNERLPSLTIAKETSPSGATDEFGFGSSASQIDPFTLTDGQHKTFDMPLGEVTITEDDVPLGWSLDDISCSGTTVTDKDVATGAVTVDLAYGEQAECLYTNGQLPPATLTVVKDDVTATWDPKFRFEAVGPGLDSSFELNLGDSKSFTVAPGVAGATFTVTEDLVMPAPPDGQSGFTLTSIECVNDDQPIPGDPNTGEVAVSLKPGDAAVCTYTNQQLPRLTIVKNAVPLEDPVDGTEFDFGATGLSETGFTLKHAEQQVFRNLTPLSAFSVTEITPPTEWQLTSLACTGGGSDRLTIDLAAGSLSGNLSYGDDVVCTYVNTQVPPKAYLYVAKYTDPAGSTEAFDFTAEGTGLDEAFQLTDGDFVGFEVDPGLADVEYTVTEIGRPGWRIDDLFCVNSSPPDTRYEGDKDSGVAKITLTGGEVGVCVYTNQQKATLSVDKVTDVISTQEFPFTVTSDPVGISPSTFDLIGGGTPQVFTDITAGTEIDITETVPTSPPPRWALEDIACDGTQEPPVYVGPTATVKLEAGEDGDCTYFNAQVPPATVQIVKAADPADGTEFDFTATGVDGGVLPADQAFSLAPDGDIDVKTLTVYPSEAGELFTFAEPAVPADWKLTGLVCVDEGGPVGTPDFTAAGGDVDVTVDPGDTITCTFTNTKDATLTVIKEAPDDPTKVFDFSWDAATPTTFTLKDQQSKLAAGLEAGVYTVQEKDLPADWYLSGPAGAHPTCVGTEAEIKYTVDLGAELTLAAGEDVTCTFANFFDYRPELELVKTPSRTVVLDGGTVKYTYELTNTGTVPLAAVGDIVVDDQCDAVIFVGGAGEFLEPGQTWTFECTVDPMSEAKATNKATATMQDPKTGDEVLATDEQTVEVRVPGLQVVKTVDQPVVYPGGDVVYTYVVTNTGQTPFEGSHDLADWIEDDQCAPVSYVDGDAGVSFILDIGESWIYTCASTLSVDTTNTVTFTGTPFIPASKESGDKQTGEPMAVEDSALVEVIDKGIAVAKSASAPGAVMKDGVLLVPVGSEVTYTYRVTTGAATVPMRVLDVTDNKCAPVDYQSGDTNSDGLVDLDETWIYNCSSTFGGTTTVKNTVVVTALEPILGGLATDADEATVRSYRGSISIQKTPSADLVAKGADVTYTYVVRNSGSVDLRDIKVSDDKCAALVYTSGDDGDGVMKPVEQWSYTCVHPLQDDTTNTADVTGATPGGGTVTDSSSATVLVVGGRLNPAIAVTKTASAASVVRGGSVTYRYEVKNAGTMPLANVRMNDDRCSPVTYVSGDDNADGLLTSTANGEGWPDETWVYTCTTTLRVTTTNTVTATGSPWSNGAVIGADVSAQAQAKVTVVVPRKPLPIEVDAVKQCKGDTCTLVEKSNTNKHGTLKFRTRCRPVGSSASGDVRYCRTKVTKKGAVKVKVIGYPKVKVTVWIQARPKKGSATDWKRSSWKRSWIIRT